ncbi:hypothetical protein GGR51DRAFT_525156 [Nemania sp. FL0031]|nr:hypothetical protein GGR51DRAFT_525156 [Nemania sp. FL0031]
MSERRRPLMFGDATPPPLWLLPRVRAHPLTNQLMPDLEVEDNENTRARERAASVSHLLRLGILGISPDNAGGSSQAFPAAADDQDEVSVSNQDTSAGTSVSSPGGSGQADQGSNDMRHHAIAASAPSTPFTTAIRRGSPGTVTGPGFGLRPSPVIQSHSGDRHDVFIPGAISLGNGFWLDSNFRREAAAQPTDTQSTGAQSTDAPYVATPYVATPYIATPYVATPYVSAPYVNAPYPNTPYVNTPYVNTPYPKTPYPSTSYPSASYPNTQYAGGVASTGNGAAGVCYDNGFAGPSQNGGGGGGPANAQGRPSHEARLNNTCLRIARLPADCELKDLFPALAGCGKIYSANISQRPDSFYEYAAANVTFWDLADLNKFIAKVRRGEFEIKGLRPTVSGNRYVGASLRPSHQSRVVVVGGPSGIINRGFLDLNVFTFFYEVEDVIYRVQFQWWNSLEYRFASVGQAEEAVKALNRFKGQTQGHTTAQADWREVKIRYGDDPCEKEPYV